MTRLPARPKLAAKSRLVFDRHEQQHVLLYPEKGLLLSESAAAIVELCDGRRTIDDIVEALSRRHEGTGRERIDEDVRGFLEDLQRRGLVAEGG